MNRAETIRQITEALNTLSEVDLHEVYERVRILRDKSVDDHSLQRPFVDEIERVKEQTRDLPGLPNDPQFT